MGKVSEYEVTCTVCNEEEITVVGNYLQEDGNRNPAERPDRICEKCQWKENFDKSNLDLVVDGVDTGDYPDFCDAYTSLESTYDGEEMEDWQCEWIDEQYPELVNEAAFEKYI